MGAERTNRNLAIQPNDKAIVSTSSWNNFPIRLKSIYEWRIIGLIVAKMQIDFGDRRFSFSEDLRNQKPLLDSIRTKRLSFGSIFREDEIEIIFPMELVLYRDKDDKLRGYREVKKALRNLAIPVEYENKTLKEKLFDANCKDSGIIWGLAQVIEKPKIIKLDGVNYLYFRVPERTWEVLCQWEKGVHIFELSVFFKFVKAETVPFYVLLADYRKTGSVVLETNYIKEFLSPGEYRDYSSFRRRVLDMVKEDMKEHSPFYFEINEFSDKACLIPAKKGRGRTAKYAKIEIIYQQGKNTEVDKCIEIFRGLNPLSPFRLHDLLDNELHFLKKNLCFKEIRGKNLDTIVRLKYYLNFGHQNVQNWRTNPGNFFLKFLENLYDTIMLSGQTIKSVPAYAIKVMQEKLATYEPSAASVVSDNGPD